MLYISAQPDQIYFIWQLEIQLRNFHYLQITKDQVHVLVAYKPNKGLSKQFEKFMEEYADLANFYSYPDLREESKYTSSVRPNILKQHFSKYPELVNETIFYHDSDILFSRTPQITSVEANDVCYLSDTRNYLDVSYIRRVSSEQLLDDMLGVVGLSKYKLLQEDSQTGGAQYILKDITGSFWEKVEKDCEILYVKMQDYNTKLWEREYPQKKEYKSKKRGIQAWCADMWAVLWNLWLYNKKVEIHPEMDFSWPYSPISEWDIKAIQHYSGDIKEKTKYFKKAEYFNYPPWYDDSLSEIPQDTCSYKIVELIRDKRMALDSLRPKFKDFCIVFALQKAQKCDGFEIARNYIQKFIDIDVHLFFDKGYTSILFNNNGNSPTSLGKNYSRILVVPSPMVFDAKSLIKIFESSFDCYWPSELYKVDSLFSETFSKVLNIELLDKNKGKFNSHEVNSDMFIRSYPALANTEKLFTEQSLARPRMGEITTAYLLS